MYKKRYQLNQRMM